MTERIPAWVDGTLVPVEKLEVHRRGLRHPAISVFVMDGDRTLIQRRAYSKYHTPGLWANSCCTHPRWGEDPAVCAQRRLSEELGITGLTLHRAGGIEYRAKVGRDLTEHEVVEIFAAEAGPDLPLALNPDEVAETAWIGIDALKREVQSDRARFTPWLGIYLAEGWGDVLLATSGRRAA